MQEEIEQKTVNLTVPTTKLSARAIIRAEQAYLRHHEIAASQGKQSVKRLLSQNCSV